MTPLASPSLSIGSTLGRYRLMAWLGQGGMAEVYQAYQAGLDRYVALKVLNPDLAKDEGFVERFEREAALIARLRHPNIVQVFDFDAFEDHYYMVMELIEGPTLADEIFERTRYSEANYAAFSPLETASLFQALASAVDYAHARNMIHRDLKPGNIMFTADGQVVLTDFGIAHIIGEARLGPTTNAPVGTPIYMAPELGQGSTGDKFSDIYSLGIVLYGLMTGHVPFEGNSLEQVMRQHAERPIPPPSVFNPDVRPDVEQVILKALSKAPDERYPSASAMALALREAFGLSLDELTTTLPIVARPARPTAELADITPMLAHTQRPEAPPCPYRGLFAFREDDAPFFFGREEFTDRLSDLVDQQRLVAVVGPSGSGKSSVVFAGLLPQLRQAASLRQAQGKAWLIADLRPGSRPFDALAAALASLNGLGDGAALANALRTGSTSLATCAQHLLKSKPDVSRVMLVIDQFEELFTLCPEPDVRRAFLEVLLEGVKRNPALHLVLTLRADFLGQAFAHRAFADALQHGSLILGPMTSAELGRAITEPARKQNVKFQSGLVERILDDVGSEPGNLPLLEFALTALWDRQIDHELKHAAYDEIGRVDGALARYADEVFHDLTPEQQQQARRAFVQMVRPGENTEDARRQATRAELEDVWPVVQQLANTRLLVTNRDPDGQETVEIVHEALIHNWSRLREWMRANRNFRAWQERLRGMLQQWEASQRDEGALLRGALLVGAEGWLAEREAEIGQAERDFIHASIALRERETAEREAQRQRLAEAERRRTSEQASLDRQRRDRSLFLGVTLVLLAIAVGAVLVSAFIANRSIRSANAQAQAAQARELAAQAQLALDTDPQLSLLLALRAAALTESVLPEAENALRQTLATIDPELTLPGSLQELIAVARTRLTRAWTSAECEAYLRAACPEEP